MSRLDARLIPPKADFSAPPIPALQASTPCPGPEVELCFRASYSFRAGPGLETLHFSF